MSRKGRDSVCPCNLLTQEISDHDVGNSGEHDTISSSPTKNLVARQVLNL